ncbi:MAG: tRNA preQ1(34) S-adenosylmethionine ribosyltransferase-isomerase QueA [Patescibacteria group bacterium]|nr:tRNA preQ1(34) S-adenosylmethionine ribosyltransferase-isomerase QueA [Patescibacteria group bacterium]
MKTSDFDYILPPDSIAQEPVRPRDSSKLLILDRQSGALEHKHFYDTIDYLRPGDLLVVNRSKVFKARLLARLPTDVEVFLLHPEGDKWIALAKPGRKLKIGSIVEFADGSTCNVVGKKDDGTVILDFQKPPEEVLTLTDKIGQVPTPPYVEKKVSDASDYQTIYAKEIGSVAAPTAGFHFTPELMEKLKSQGVKFAEVILHVGLGTFRPMKTDTLEEHVMHEEWLDIPVETSEAIKATKQNNGRVIAVGTTTVRALESGITHGFTKLFITPGYRFKTIDGLITNFHLPKSTLIVLVSSFVGEHKNDPDWGRQTVLRAYSEAISKGYRFYSFGDAMLIK